MGSNLADVARWIHTNPEIETDEDDGDPVAHGSCMLSRAAGHLYGVAKNVYPVIVRRPRGLFDFEYALEGMRRIAGELAGNERRDGSALTVLSMSFVVDRINLVDGEPTFQNADGSDGYEHIRAVTYDILKRLVNRGVLPVAASGNDGQVSVRHPWPLTTRGAWSRCDVC